MNIIIKKISVPLQWHWLTHHSYARSVPLRASTELSFRGRHPSRLGQPLRPVVVESGFAASEAHHDVAVHCKTPRQRAPVRFSTVASKSTGSVLEIMARASVARSAPLRNKQAIRARRPQCRPTTHQQRRARRGGSTPAPATCCRESAAWRIIRDRIAFVSAEARAWRGVQVPSRLSASPKPIVAIGPVARATRRLNHSTHGPEIQPSRATRYGTKERDSLGDYLPRAAARSRSCCGWERLRTSAIRSDRQAERCEPRGPGHYSANVKKHGTTTVIQ